jgi:hypothetical protein
MGGGNSRSVAVDEANSMTATVITNVALTCESTADFTQSVNITCDPDIYSSAVSPLIWEMRPSCTSCFANLERAQMDYYNQVRSSWRTGATTINKPIDRDYMNVVQIAAECSGGCKACNVQDITQNGSVLMKTTCESFNSIRNTITQMLTSQINEKLTNNQGALSGAADVLGRLLGASTRQQIDVSLANRMSSQITNNVVAAIRSQIQAEQNFTVHNGTVVGATQNSTYNSVKTYLGKTNIMDNIFSEAEWKVIATLDNEQNSIDALGNLVRKSAEIFAKLVENNIGKVVIAVIGLLGVLLVGVFIYAVVRQARKLVSQLEKTHNKQEKEAETQPVFTTF